MYQVHLKFWLGDLPQALCNALQQAPARARFSHEFHTWKSTAVLSAGRDTVVLFTDTVPVSPAELRAVVGEAATCVLVTDHADRLEAHDLAMLDDVWPAMGSAALWTFRVRLLLDRLQARKEAWLTATYLDKCINMSQSLIWFKDVKGAHLKVNDAFCEVVGKEKSDIEGRGHYYIWGLTEEEYAKGEFVCLETEEEVMRKRTTCVFEEQVQAPEGLRQLLTFKTPVFDEDGSTLLGTIGIAYNVTKEKEYREKITELARRDALTNLSNRWHLREFIKKNPIQKGDIGIYFDLDRFKEVNDTYGHLKGDEVLQCMARLLKDCFPYDFLVRLGGDEFFVIVKTAQVMEAVEARVQNFLAALTARMRVVVPGGVTSSVGIAMADGAIPVDLLLHRADIALYRTKARGRDSYAVYTSDMEADGALQKTPDADECRALSRGDA